MKLYRCAGESKIKGWVQTKMAAVRSRGPEVQCAFEKLTSLYSVDY